MDTATITSNLLKVFSGLIKDVESLLSLENEVLHCDYVKVASSVRSRGLGVFLLDFPSLCSGLEASLESGDWGKMLGLPFFRKSGPTIFKPLFSKIFSESGELRDDPCVQSIRALRQLLKFAKKLRVDAPVAAVTEKYREFADIEAELYPPVLSWGSEYLRCTSGYPTLANLGLRRRELADGLYGSVSDSNASKFLGILDAIQSVCDGFTRHFAYREEWFIPKHGPGSVSEKFGESKFDFPTWPYRLELKFPFDKYGLVNHQIWGDQIPLDHSSPCKLIGVPKDFRGPRLIASEPIASQYVQQGLMNVIRENVKRSALRHCIDFRSQEPSRDLVLQTSLDREFSTIDLSSASDRLSCAVVECVFRRNYSFLEMLNAARTPEVLFPDGKIVRMKKFAAQGAAFTFPVQSIVYALICMGTIKYFTEESRLSVLAKQVRVYGDDMIVPTRFFHDICQVLEILQLKVNWNKSFHKGYFRESCGMDAYKGRDITPANVLTFYNSRDPNTLVSTVECANNLFMKGFDCASRHLLETIPRKVRKLIPSKGFGSTAFGIYSYTPTVDNHRNMKYRYNQVLHRAELQCLTVESKVTKSVPDGHAHLLQWFHEKPRADTVWRSGEVTRVKARYRLRWVPVVNFH